MKERISCFLIVFLSCQIVLGQSITRVESHSTCCSESSCSLTDADMSSICQGSCSVKDYDPESVVTATDAKVGDLTICPVSKVVFEVKSNSPKVQVEGEDVYVCCSACSAIYNLDPKKYAKSIKLE